MNINKLNSVNYNKPMNFGMAKFSKRGMDFALSCSDVYEKLGTPEKFQSPEFFKPVGILGSPFAKFVKQNASNPEEIAKAITDCGATDNAHTNALFIKQLIASQKQINKLGEKEKAVADKAIETVFGKNWNNPELNKKETLTLLNMAKDSLESSVYATLIGVIEQSNIR